MSVIRHDAAGWWAWRRGRGPQGPGHGSATAQACPGVQGLRPAWRGGTPRAPRACGLSVAPPAGRSACPFEPRLELWLLLRKLPGLELGLALNASPGAGRQAAQPAWLHAARIAYLAGARSTAGRPSLSSSPPPSLPNRARLFSLRRAKRPRAPRASSLTDSPLMGAFSQNVKKRLALWCRTTHRARLRFERCGAPVGPRSARKRSR